MDDCCSEIIDNWFKVYIIWIIYLNILFVIRVGNFLVESFIYVQF